MMRYLIFAIAVWAVGLVWLWWAAKHAPLMDEHEQTCPPYQPPEREEDV